MHACMHANTELYFTDEESVLEAVLAVDSERTALLEEEARLQKKQHEQTKADGVRLAHVYTRLEEIDASSAEAHASTVLSGLGFTEAMMRQSAMSLSGGWRMRVALARALFSDPDILLLDEPTNHLDLHAVAWLADRVKKSPKTYIIVSHARDFLNGVCTDIMLFHDKSLKYYRGDYDNFEATRAEQLRQQQKQFESQQAHMDHVQKFVDRFRYNASRAALVQSRIKALKKLPMLEAVASDPAVCFEFAQPEKIPTPHIDAKEVCFKYNSSASEWLLKDVNISLTMDSRVAICGLNGSGKSTLMKLMAGELDPQEGFVNRHNKLRIGYFTQHHVDTLDLTLNAVQQLQKSFPSADLGEEACRNYFGKFGISGLLALEPLYVLSGGQKSRVAIALMAFNTPHMLLLDEPTNHLDLEAAQALIAALAAYEGGVVIVSHDAHLISCVVDDVWHVDGRKHSCTQFKGDFDVYKKKELGRSVAAAHHAASAGGAPAGGGGKG
eukprot:GHVU01139237.1.p1 GENE.GHVU01139237.1~~GHVU01139237.1.p1  ORF type:complete len:497 (-),score=150.63 GHVU01139237.1:404-1894(-)